MSAEYITAPPGKFLETFFDSPAQVLVNPVNCKGKMGAGMALEYKKRWPQMFEAYKLDCREGILVPGVFTLWHAKNKKIILNFPTKDDWREDSTLEMIELGLQRIRDTCWASDMSIAFPKLGCGKGGLDWADVKPLMEKYLGDLGIQVYIHV